MNPMPNLPASGDADTSLQVSSISRLFERINYERQEAASRGALKLDAVQHLAEWLGNPHRNYPILHVAGTKGKGTVTNLLGAILRSAGLRTGVYTSPHLDCFNQRFVVDGLAIQTADLEDLLDRIWPFVIRHDREQGHAPGRHLTFFDIATVAAFQFFADQQVAAASIEVGLGGRLDSTNICLPEVTVITSISLDHCRQLGETEEKIAAEKAGIIKVGIPVISGVQPGNAQAVIAEIAADRSAPLYQLGADFHCHALSGDWSGMEFSTNGNVAGIDYQLNKLKWPLLGQHQAENAAVAIAAAVVFQQRRGIDLLPRVPAALRNFQHPGRIELIRCSPHIVLDVAHNPASIAALINTLDRLPAAKPDRKKIAIVAISRDKDQLGILKQLTSYFDLLVLTRFVENPRATPPEQLRDMAIAVTKDRQLPEFLTAESPGEAWQIVEPQLSSADLCVVTGSVFLVSELRPTLLLATHSRD